MNYANLGSKLAEGRTAKIYAWKPGWVLKLYRDWMPPEDATHESMVTRAAHDSGFRAPAIRELIEIDGRTGLEMEHIEGEDMLAALMAAPWRVDALARQLANLHREMHACRPTGLPDQHAVLRRRLQIAPHLAEDLRQRLLARLETLPAGDRLLHGDLHPLNVVLAPDGPVVIDWIDAKCGNPLADVARSTVLLTIGSAPEPYFVRLFITLFRRRFHSTYHRTYFSGLQDAALAEYHQWLPVMAADRLNENLENETQALLSAIRRWLD